MDPLTFAVLSNYLACLSKDLTSAAVRGAITAVNKSQGSKSMDIEHEFDNLRKELRSMQCLLRDEEQRKQDSESQANWVEEVKEAAQDVEDTMDLIVYFGHCQEWDKSWNSQASDYIGTRLTKVKEEFENIKQRRDRYLPQLLMRREEQSYHGGCQMWQPHEELPHETMGTDVVGMEQNEATVIAWLLGETDDAPRNMVISICGMGGLGKTCLARRVYNDQRVRRHFDCFAWVSISKTYNAEELLRSIIRQIIGMGEEQAAPDELDRSSSAALVGLLDQCRHQKRYVIVLDDVWSRNACNDFSYLLQNDKVGSRVIVTTRDHHVAASLCIDSHILNLQPLPESEAWTLFCKKAFWIDPDKSCPKDLEDWARKIVAKCEGLPLAVLTLGSVLSSKDRSPLTWKRFYNGIGSELSNNEMLVTMSRILMLCYADLPNHLKRCYLHCGSLFPESHVIKKNWLLRLWVAEGLVEDIHGMTSEEVAEGYFDELILRSMLQVARKDESGRVKACRMHILMREVTLCVSKADKLCAVLDEQGARVDDVKARRLSVQIGIEKAPAVPPNNKKEEAPLSRLRSLLFFVDDQASAASFLTMSPNLMLLKVLELRNVPIDHVPGEVFDLFNLRYLSLRDTKVEVLPKYVKRLKMLETLDLRGTKVICLPHEVAKLKELRHLLMDCVYVLKKIKKGRGIINLVSDQATMKKIDDLLNQKAPRIKTDTISWIRDMKDLLTLKTVEADEGLIAEIAALVRLRRLGLTNVHEEDGIQLCNSISKMGQLLSLTIDAASDEALMLDSLSSPPPHLRKLVLDGQLWKVPPWFNLLSSLTHLHLLDSQLEATCSPIPHLEKLDSLAHLTLRRAYKGEQLRFRANMFLRLKSLNVAELNRLSQLDMEKGALPTLSLLHLTRCRDLQGEGLCGIDNLPALRHLYLQDMPESLVCSLGGDHRLKASTGWESISKSTSWL
ncbi:Disease resistance protein [Musa troglodytarum]|uniref:Disease resistance protein n=1 Tax=Musa troglodytarum TaxID=320322 RepID=A0A9E7KYP3_9LILI|nr:Disease resistance protein [Musa troglodytarum]